MCWLVKISSRQSQSKSRQSTHQGGDEVNGNIFAPPVVLGVGSIVLNKGEETQERWMGVCERSSSLCVLEQPVRTWRSVVMYAEKMPVTCSRQCVQRPRTRFDAERRRVSTSGLAVGRAALRLGEHCCDPPPLPALWPRHTNRPPRCHGGCTAQDQTQTSPRRSAQRSCWGRQSARMSAAESPGWQRCPCSAGAPQPESAH